MSSTFSKSNYISNCNFEIKTNMTEAYIFLSSFIILGGTFIVDYLSNRNSKNNNKYVLGILYLLVSSGLIIQLTNYLHFSSDTMLKISFLNKTLTIIFK